MWTYISDNEPAIGQPIYGSDDGSFEAVGIYEGNAKMSVGSKGEMTFDIVKWSPISSND